MALPKIAASLRGLPLFGNSPGHYAQAQGTLLSERYFILQLLGMFWIMADYMRLGVLVCRLYVCGREELFDSCGLNQIRIRSAH